MIKLYTSFRSSAAYRVRIALALKGLPYESEYVDLDKKGGVDRSPHYLAVNPLGIVPTLVEGRRVYRKSEAILEYLEECYPNPTILPGGSRDRERIRSLSQVVVTDIAALIEPRVIGYLQDSLGQDDAACEAWSRYWVENGLRALENLMGEHPASAVYCHADIPTLADISLVSVVHGLVSQGWQFDDFPTVKRIYEACMQLDAFSSTVPEAQPDALR